MYSIRYNSVLETWQVVEWHEKDGVGTSSVVSSHNTSMADARRYCDMLNGIYPTQQPALQSPGISRRDYFAGMALQGQLANGEWSKLSDLTGSLPALCVSIADALIAELDKTHQTTRYDWSAIDEKFKYAATDEDGQKVAYQNEPSAQQDKDGGYWSGGLSNTIQVLGSTKKHTPDWMVSLERRPQPLQP